ncbi:MAG: exo-alpha-sialidase [Acidobacteria bacterium]|nr:exo-alpha-sialidase [Acidobacteriota bacterium]
MPEVRHVSPRNGDVLVLVGTMKGSFIFRSGRSREKWEIGGPYFAGCPVYAMTLDSRAGRQRLWAGAMSWAWGASTSFSDDFGETWSDPETSKVKFPESSGGELKQIWQITPGRDSEPDTIYCGVEPAALFVSRDAGATWSLVEGLWNHEHRPRWMPGAGGLCLHTILLDPSDEKKMRIAISAAGMYVTDDGGATWRPSNKGVRAEFLPDKYPEFGQCVHKVVQSPTAPERMYLQNHWGLYRSDDWGESWSDVANGVPSDFGFAMAVHPEDPDTAWIVPLESDGFRCTPEGKLRVYRTRDGAGSWKPMTRGLPQKGALETVLRDSLAVDPLDPVGVYFGTRSGKLFGSSDEGKSWELMADGLPPIVSVRAAVVSKPRRKAK